MFPKNLFSSLILTCVISISVNAQELIYPYELREYYPTLKQFNPGKAITLQEWRRAVDAKEITKGLTITYDGKGKMSEIRTPDKQIWNYSYDNRNRPTKIVASDEFGETETYSFYYRKTNYEWIRRGSGDDRIEEKTIYFYDKRRRIVEEKSYSHDYDFDSLMLDERTVKTYSSPTDERVSGEMNYLYFPAWENYDGYFNQGKTVYLYDGDKLSTKIVYLRVNNTTKKPLRADQLSSIKEKEIYKYDEKGRLIEMFTTERLEEEIYDRTTYNYDGDNLAEYATNYYTRNNVGDYIKGARYHKTRLLFNKEGFPVSHYMNSLYEADFRASFTVKELLSQ